MKGATHFIEQYRLAPPGSPVKSSKPIPIQLLKGELDHSKVIGCKTIAVFYIKPKTPVILATHDKEIRATIIENG